MNHLCIPKQRLAKEHGIIAIHHIFLYNNESYNVWNSMYMYFKVAMIPSGFVKLWFANLRVLQVWGKATLTISLDPLW